jgi:iron complex transport system substrate-binding protein
VTIDASVRALSATGEAVFTLDADLLAALAPEVILTQALCDVCALPPSTVDRAVETLAFTPTVVSLEGSTLAGVWNDIRRVGATIGREPEADTLITALDARMRRVHDTLKAARAPRPRVAVIEWMDPLFAAGHWTPDLVRRAGGIDVLAEAGTHSVECTAARIRQASPDVVLFAPCGFDVERSTREGEALLATPDWRWARGLRCWALDGNALTSRPGPRLVDAIEMMAAIFAPTLFVAPPMRYARELLA